MGKLIKSQLRLVFHNKLFYICLALIALDPIMSFTGIFSSATKNSLVFPSIVTFIGGQVSTISLIFVVIFCCYDFSDGTTKNIIGRGYTKTQLLLSKYIVSLIGLFAIYAIVCVLYFILFIKNGFGFQSNLVYPLIDSLVGIVAYTVLYGTIAFLIEKNGYGIVACLFLPTIISIGLGIIDSKLKWNLSDFWMNAGSIKFTTNPTLGNLSISILYYVVYIVIFIIVGTQVLKNREIK